MARLYLIIIILSILGGSGYSAYTYFLWSQETIGTLRENNVKLKSAAETLQNTVDTIKKDAEQQAQLNKDLTKRLQQSQEHLDKLRGVFAKIDLTMEALTNAQGLEERVDRAVEKLIGRIARETDPNPVDDTAASSVQSPDGAGSSSND